MRIYQLKIEVVIVLKGTIGAYVTTIGIITRSAVRGFDGFTGIVGRQCNIILLIIIQNGSTVQLDSIVVETAAQSGAAECALSD